MPNSYDTFLLTLRNVYTAVQKDKCYSLDDTGKRFPTSKPSLRQLKILSPLSYCNRPCYKVCPHGTKTICHFELTAGDPGIEADNSWKLYLVRNVAMEKMCVCVCVYIFFFLFLVCG